MSNDVSDFIDSEFQSARKTAYAAPLRAVEPAPAAAASAESASRGSSSMSPGSSNRPPTRQEIETQVSANQQELAKLKRAQEELERERVALEDLRRRRAEFENGRQEMLQNLTRGIGLLEDSELSTRREADQMARSLAEFREAVGKVQSINENIWTQENMTVELTRALTTIENARMEWNSARLKFPFLNGETEEAGLARGGNATPAFNLASMGMLQLCKLGFAFTWPLAAIGLIIFLTLLFRH